MFIKVTGTRPDIRWCYDTLKNVCFGDTQDIWILNTDYIVGISNGSINLSCYVENAQKQVAYSEGDTDTHSFYIPLRMYHTVETETWSLNSVIQIELLNRSKENDQ